MKKIYSLLLMSLVYFSVSNAQENLIIGGDFEDVNILTFGNDSKPVYLPGWDLLDGKSVDDLDYNYYNNVGFDMWSVNACMLYEEEPIGENQDNYQHLRLKRYDWDGWWGDFGPTQTIPVTPQTKYQISFDCRINPKCRTQWDYEEGVDYETEEELQELLLGFGIGDGFAGSYPSSSVIIKDGKEYMDETGFVHTSDSVISLHHMNHLEWDKENLNNNWERKTFVFETLPTMTELKIKFSLKGSKPNPWNGNFNVWMDLDNIEMYEYTGTNGIAEVSKNSNVTISNWDKNIKISGLKGENRIEIFTLSGSVVKSFISNEESVLIPIQEGVYIVRVGDIAKKVIL